MALAIFATLVLLTADAGAAADPKFEYGKAEEVKETEWKVSAQLGLILTTGNSKATALSGSALASRKEGNNKFALDVGGAYTRSRVLLGNDADMSGTIGPSEIIDQVQTTTRNWNLKLRYDRFFTTHDSAFISGRIASDEPAGKELFGGGQIGYSRLLVKSEQHELVVEAGYDFTYENYVLETVKNLAIHSARLFAGWTAKLSDVTGFVLNGELLMNLNSEDGPRGEISSFEDSRVTGKAALTTKIWKKLDFRFSFTARFDNAPAPQPPFSLPYDDGFIPLADKLDITAEAALIINFL